VFVWEFSAANILDQLMDWIYGMMVGFLSDFFAMMNSMGAELFELPWVEGIVSFFSNLGWMLFAVGLVIACFECAIEYQSGRGSVKDIALNAIRGFFAVSLFSTLPVLLYQEVVTLERSLTGAIAGITMNNTAGGIADTAMESMYVLENMALGAVVGIFCLFMMGYAVFKVFFSNLKRGGILLIMIAVGSLYMFSVPRGYIDGFTGWCKQVIALCLTTFLQSAILTAGLFVLREELLLGLGLMLSAGEIPRIAGNFGLETGTRANITGSIYAAQHALTLTRTIKQLVR
jgi:hypothetical protein